MSKQSDLSFASELRDVMGLEKDTDLDFVFSPDVRARSAGSWPGWLYRPMRPIEKRKMVLDYCRGDSVRNIAHRFNRGKGTVANLLKVVGVYLSPIERDPEKIEQARNRISEFIATQEIEVWHAEWLLAWRKRKIVGVIAKAEEELL